MSERLTENQRYTITVTDNQRYIMERAARVVREILDLVEVYAPETPQREKLKQLMENSIYAFRDDMLKKFTITKPAGQKEIS